MCKLYSNPSKVLRLTLPTLLPAPALATGIASIISILGILLVSVGGGFSNKSVIIWLRFCKASSFKLTSPGTPIKSLKKAIIPVARSIDVVCRKIKLIAV